MISFIHRTGISREMVFQFYRLNENNNYSKIDGKYSYNSNNNLHGSAHDTKSTMYIVNTHALAHIVSEMNENRLDASNKRISVITVNQPEIAIMTTDVSGQNWNIGR